MNILTSDVLVSVYGAYENLVVSSVGLKRLNLLGSSSSSSASMSSLGCVISFSGYLVLKLVISALTLRRLMSYIYMEHPFLMFLDHTQRRSTVGRTPLDE